MPLLLLLCPLLLWAQQQDGIEGLRMAPRANVVSYEDENAIEKLRYEQSPNYLPMDDGWTEEVADGHKVWSQQYDIPKEWRDSRIFIRLHLSPGYGFYIGNTLIGVSHDAVAATEFDISGQVRFGKSMTFAIQFVAEDDSWHLDLPSDKEGITGSCAVLRKPLLNVQDYTITTSYSPADQSGEYTLDADLFNAKKKGRAFLEVEIWDPQGHQVDKTGKWVFFGKCSDASQLITSTLSKVQPWNAEVPRLYTLVVRLYNEYMELQDIVGTRFGFRTLSMDNGFLLNGQAITFRGITVLTPIAMSTPQETQLVRSRLVQMKQQNINAVRTLGGGPAPARFYELCDELGFYVVCDANLFPQSSLGHVVAADNEYADLFCDRMRNMYGEYKNHPSIVAWSLGECSDNGICLTAAYQTLKQLDKERPVLCAGAQYADNTDVICLIQADIDQLRQYRAKNVSRPLVMLSYGSTVGNGFGGMSPLWQMVSDHQMIQGGFFSCDDWEAFSHLPYIAELKYLYRPFDLRLTSSAVDMAELSITNRCNFRQLSDYKLDYVVCSSLKPHVVEGDVSFSLQPGESKPVKLKIPKLNLYTGEELFLQFTLRQRNNTPAVPKNTVLSTAQFPLQSDNNPRQTLAFVDPQPLAIEKDSTRQVHIYNRNISILFSDSLGCITSVSRQGQPLVTQPLQLNFMRDPTPSDHMDPNGLRQWNRYGRGEMDCQVVATSCRAIDDYTVGIDVMLQYSAPQLATAFSVRQTYMVLQSGDILLKNDIDVSPQLKSVARVGMSCRVSSELTLAEWMGRDVESYTDRQGAGRIAENHSSVADLARRYAAQQEAGNRTEVRWAALRNDQVGLYVDLIDTLCQFSIQEEVLNIDYRSTGIGGAYGGINLDESALVKDHRYQFTLHLRPYDCLENDAHDFRRIIYPAVASSMLDMPVITRSRNRFDAPMLVSIAHPVPDVEIRYTLDGSLPTEHSARYVKPFAIQGSTLVRARAFKKGCVASFAAEQHFSFDYIESCTFAHKPNTPYNKNIDRALIDGEKGDVNDLSRGWLGFSAYDMQADLRLAKAIEIGSVTIRFAHVPDAWVFAPAECYVSVSSDGETYTRPVAATILYDPAAESMNTTQLQTLVIPVSQADVRFVRVLAKPIDRIPAWHRAKDLNPWIMLDEITIEEATAR